MWPLHRNHTKLTKVRFAKALGTLLLSFAAAYGPAFLTVALLKLRPFEAVPAIIVISLAMAILLIKVVSGKAGGFAKFGFRFCHCRYIAAAIVFVGAAIQEEVIFRGLLQTTLARQFPATLSFFGTS